MNGEEVDVDLGEFTPPSVPIKYLTNDQFIAYIDSLWAAFDNAALIQQTERFLET